MARKPNEHLSLYLLKLAGIGSLFVLGSILAPQFPLTVIKHLIKKKFGAKYNSQQISASVQYLKRKKFIAVANQRDSILLTLTAIGKKHLKRASIDLIQIKPHNWDGKWRVLMFDIPEEHKAARHIFRRKLKELGFIHFQRSVFLFPYKCESEIKNLAANLSILPFAHILTAERFRHDEKLLQKFHLNST